MESGWLRAHPNLLISLKSIFQKQSYFEELGARMSTYEYRGDKIQPRHEFLAHIRKLETPHSVHIDNEYQVELL